MRGVSGFFRNGLSERSGARRRKRDTSEKRCGVGGMGGVGGVEGVGGVGGVGEVGGVGGVRGKEVVNELEK